MLNLLHSRSNFVFVAFVVLFIIEMPPIMALNIGISPPQMEFIIDNAKECREITLYSDRAMNFYVYDLWSLDSSFNRNFSTYVHSAKEANVEITYEPIVFVDGSAKFEVCITKTVSGVSRGILMARTENGIAEIGSWIVAVKSDLENKAETDNKKAFVPLIFEFILSGIAITCALILLMIKSRKKA